MQLLYSFFISLSLCFTSLWNFYTIIITSFFTAMFSRSPTTTTTTVFLLHLFTSRLVLLLLLTVLLLLLHFSCLLRFSHFFFNFRWFLFFHCLASIFSLLFAFIFLSLVRFCFFVTRRSNTKIHSLSICWWDSTIYCIFYILPFVTFLHFKQQHTLNTPLNAIIFFSFFFLFPPSHIYYTFIQNFRWS